MFTFLKDVRYRVLAKASLVLDIRTGNMALLLTCLLWKRHGLSFDLQHSRKGLWRVLHFCDPSLTRRHSHGQPWSPLTSQPSPASEFHIQWDTVSKVSWKVIKEDIQHGRPPRAHSHILTLTHRRQQRCRTAKSPDVTLLVALFLDLSRGSWQNRDLPLHSAGWLWAEQSRSRAEKT